MYTIFPFMHKEALELVLWILIILDRRDDRMLTGIWNKILKDGKERKNT